MNTIKYKVLSWSIEIEEVLCVKETKHFLTISETNLDYITKKLKTTERRTARADQYKIYFNTHTEAKAHLIKRLKDSIDNKARQIKSDYAQLEKVKAYADQADDQARNYCTNLDQSNIQARDPHFKF